jgi:methylenetetrahydrofolate dehydrogenase (NADP+)/methenyltetrahydrofolate cyclohydrolase
MQLLDGKGLSETIKKEIAEEVKALTKDGSRPPHLAAVLVGENPASQSYVRNKIRFCDAVGFRSSLIQLPDTITEQALLAKVEELNHSQDLDGYIVQLPLPKHIDEQKVNLAIDFRKDVDGFHPVNFGRMVQGLNSFLPATPNGILEMLKRYQIETSGKHCVVLGRSNIVGTPMSILLSRKAYPGNATVTLTHSRTQDLKSILLQADIIIAAIGIPKFVKADMVKEGAVVVDVGINRWDDETRKRGYRLVGDVDFDEVAPKCSYITPVPGGVGPMTVCALIMNTLRAYKKEVYN